MKPLHKTQRKILELLTSNKHYDPITIREMQFEIRVSSSSVIAHHLKQLEKKGYLKKNPYTKGGYHVYTEPSPSLSTQDYNFQTYLESKAFREKFCDMWKVMSEKERTYWKKKHWWWMVTLLGRMEE